MVPEPVRKVMVPATGNMRACHVCQGTGKVTKDKQTQVCIACKGTGLVDSGYRTK